MNTRALVTVSAAIVAVAFAGCTGTGGLPAVAQRTQDSGMTRFSWGPPKITRDGKPVTGEVAATGVNRRLTVLFDAPKLDLQKADAPLKASWKVKMSFPVETDARAGAELQFAHQLRLFLAKTPGASALITGRAGGKPFKLEFASGSEFEGRELYRRLDQTIAYVPGETYELELDISVERPSTEEQVVLSLDSLDTTVR